MIGLKVFWMELTGYSKKWRRNIVVGDRCCYPNLSGGWAIATVLRVRDGLASVESKSYAATVTQWIEVSRLFPLPD